MSTPCSPRYIAAFTVCAIMVSLNGSAIAQSSVERAQEVLSERPEVVDRVFACRDVADSAERLACYDQSVDQLVRASDANEVVLADQEQVQEAKKGLFGLTLPNLKILGNDDSEDAVESITAKIVSARQRQRKWLVVLEDGARWMQTDTRRLSRFPREGSEIVIRKAAMNSFLAKIDGQTAIRMRRVN